MERPRRITEPFLKVRFALWLVARGCAEITLNLDPYEVDAPETLPLLQAAGYGFARHARTTTTYAGRYRLNSAVITVAVARGGADVIATLGDGRQLAAECKGEVTPAGTLSGTDRTSVYEAIGQLIWRFGELKPPPDLVALVLPDTPRVRGFAQTASENEFLTRIPLLLALVSADGGVHEIGKPWSLDVSSRG
jgi:hypothetical protein